MKGLLRKASIKLSPEYEKYAPIIWKNRLHRLFKNTQKHKYLFILSPPYCGSTLLNEVISTSRAVSVNNTYGTREGQTLPTVRQIMFDHGKRWDKTLDFDWSYIKKEWLKYWDLRHPVLLEKSPPNLIRAKSLEENFDPAFFIIFYRNPYAHCESLIRRNSVNAEAAASFAIKCLIHQKKNLTELRNKVSISYEYLTDHTSSAIQEIEKLVPELDDINFSKEFSAHNYMNQNMKIRNLNVDKVNKLSASQLKAINSIFIKNKELLNFFNYALIEQT